MRELFMRFIMRRRLAIGIVLCAGPAVAEPPPAKESPAVVLPDKSADKPQEKPADKSADKSVDKPKRIAQLPDGSVNLSARDATVHGTKLRYERAKSTLGYWLNADDWVSWEFEITQPGKLLVDLTQSCGPDSAGSHYTVEVGDQKLKDKVQETGSFRMFRLRRLGVFEFAKPGLYTLSVRAQDKPQSAVMDLRSIRLSPLKPEKPAAVPPPREKSAPVEKPVPVAPAPTAPSPAAPKG